MAEVCSLRLWKGVAMAMLALHLSSITGEGLTAAGSNPYLSCVDLAAHPGQTVVLVCPTGDRFQVFPSQRALAAKAKVRVRSAIDKRSFLYRIDQFSVQSEGMYYCGVQSSEEGGGIGVIAVFNLTLSETPVLQEGSTTPSQYQPYVQIGLGLLSCALLCVVIRLIHLHRMITRRMPKSQRSNFKIDVPQQYSASVEAAAATGTRPADRSQSVSTILTNLQCSISLAESNPCFDVSSPAESSTSRRSSAESLPITSTDPTKYAYAIRKVHDVLNSQPYCQPVAVCNLPATTPDQLQPQEPQEPCSTENEPSAQRPDSSRLDLQCSVSLESNPGDVSSPAESNSSRRSSVGSLPVSPTDPTKYAYAIRKVHDVLNSQPYCQPVAVCNLPATTPDHQQPQDPRNTEKEPDAQCPGSSTLDVQCGISLEVNPCDVSSPAESNNTRRSSDESLPVASTAPTKYAYAISKVHDVLDSELYCHPVTVCNLPETVPDQQQRQEPCSTENEPSVQRPHSCSPSADKRNCIRPPAVMPKTPTTHYQSSPISPVHVDQVP